MHMAIALIAAIAVTAGIIWFFFAPRKAYRARIDGDMQEAVIEVKAGTVRRSSKPKPAYRFDWYSTAKRTANARPTWCSPISASTACYRPSAPPH